MISYSSLISNKLNIYSDISEFLRTIEVLKQYRIYPLFVYDEYYGKDVYNESNAINLKYISAILQFSDKQLSTLLSERKLVNDYFLYVLDQPAFIANDDHIRIRQILMDWYVSLRFKVSTSNKLTDTYSLDSYTLDELFRSFGYPYSDVISAEDEKPIFLNNLINYYHKKGSSAIIKDVFEFYGFINKIFNEWWLYTDKKGNKPSDFIAKNKVIWNESFIESSKIVMTRPYLELVANDPNWYYDKGLANNIIQILGFDVNKINTSIFVNTERLDQVYTELENEYTKLVYNSNIIELKNHSSLPSILPYVTIDSAASIPDSVMEVSILHRLLQEQYMFWLTSILKQVDSESKLTDDNNVYLKDSSTTLISKINLDNSINIIELSDILPEYWLNIFSDIDYKSKCKLPENIRLSDFNINLSLLEVFTILECLLNSKYFRVLTPIDNYIPDYIYETGMFEYDNITGYATHVWYDNKKYKILDTYTRDELTGQSKILQLGSDITFENNIIDCIYSGKWSPIHRIIKTDLENSNDYKYTISQQVSVENIKIELAKLNEFYKNIPVLRNNDSYSSFFKTETTYRPDKDEYKSNYIYYKNNFFTTNITNPDTIPEFDNIFYTINISPDDLTNIEPFNFPQLDTFYDQSSYNPNTDVYWSDESIDIIYTLYKAINNNNAFVSIKNYSGNLNQYITHKPTFIFDFEFDTNIQSPINSTYLANYLLPDICSDCSNIYCNIQRVELHKSNCCIFYNDEIIIRHKLNNIPTILEIFPFGVTTYNIGSTNYYSGNTNNTNKRDYVRLSFDIVKGKDYEFIGDKPLDDSFIDIKEDDLLIELTIFDATNNKIIDINKTTDTLKITNEGKFFLYLDLNNISCIQFRMISGSGTIRIRNFKIDRNCIFDKSRLFRYILNTNSKKLLESINSPAYYIMKSYLDSFENLTSELAQNRFDLFTLKIFNQLFTYLHVLGFGSINNMLETVIPGLYELMKRIFNFFKPFRVRLKPPTLFLLQDSRLETSFLVKDSIYYKIKNYIYDFYDKLSDIPKMHINMWLKNYFLPESNDYQYIQLTQNIDESKSRRTDNLNYIWFEERLLPDEMVFYNHISMIDLQLRLNNNYYIIENSEPNLIIKQEIESRYADISTNNTLFNDLILSNELDIYNSPNEIIFNNSLPAIDLTAYKLNANAPLSMQLKNINDFILLEEPINFSEFSTIESDDTSIVIRKGFLEFNIDTGDMRELNDPDAVWKLIDDTKYISTDYTPGLDDTWVLVNILYDTYFNFSSEIIDNQQSIYYYSNFTIDGYCGYENFGDSFVMVGLFFNYNLIDESSNILNFWASDVIFGAFSEDTYFLIENAGDPDQYLYKSNPQIVVNNFDWINDSSGKFHLNLSIISIQPILGITPLLQSQTRMEITNLSVKSSNHCIIRNDGDIIVPNIV